MGCIHGGCGTNFQYMLFVLYINANEGECHGMDDHDRRTGKPTYEGTEAMVRGAMEAAYIRSLVPRFSLRPPVLEMLGNIADKMGFYADGRPMNTALLKACLGALLPIPVALHCKQTLA
jgi:hypothetical protein